MYRIDGKQLKVLKQLFQKKFDVDISDKSAQEIGQSLIFYFETSLHNAIRLAEKDTETNE